MKLELETKKAILVGILFVVFFALFGILANESVISIMSRVVIMSLYAMSFNLMFGYTGMSSIGHALYFGVGGYSLMIFLTKAHFPLFLSVICSVLVVIPIAWFFGTVSLKNNMLSFNFLTMGMCTTVQLILMKTTSVGGTVGITYYFLPSWLNGFRSLYFFILVCCTICVILIYMITRSPYAQMLKGVRENDERLTFLGTDIRKMRRSVFIIAAVFADFAGILYAFRNSGSYTSSLDAAVSMQAIMMCIIGGRSAFVGPIIGSLILTPIQNYISVVTRYYESIIGLIILLTAYFMREGLLSRTGILMKGIKRVENRIFKVKENEDGFTTTSLK